MLRADEEKDRIDEGSIEERIASRNKNTRLLVRFKVLHEPTGRKKWTESREQVRNRGLRGVRLNPIPLPIVGEKEKKLSDEATPKLTVYSSFVVEAIDQSL